MKAWEHVTHISDSEKQQLSRHLKINPHEVTGPVSGTLVGWDCGMGHPLYPWPSNRTGGRLLKLSLLSVEMFLGRIQRKSMFAGNASTPGHTRAHEMAQEFTPGHRVVLVGQLVAVAFNFDRYWTMDERNGVFYTAIADPRDVVGTPHPANLAATCAAIQWAANHMVGMKNASS